METLEPRQVDRPFHWRWFGGALRLMLQSPLRFGMLIALLAFIDTSAAKYLQGIALPQALFEWTGLACLPVVWTLVSVLARAAERRGQTWPLLLDFGRSLAWCRALLAGILVASVIAAVTSLLNKAPHGVADALPGKLLSSFATQCYLWWAFYGLCYCPLLVFIPELRGWRLFSLSHKADKINDYIPFWLALYSGNLLALIIEEFLSYGIAAAVWLVYSGIVSYVAYKDIFECRPLRLTQPSAAAAGQQATVSTTPVWMKHGSGSSSEGTPETNLGFRRARDVSGYVCVIIRCPLVDTLRRSARNRISRGPRACALRSGCR